MSVCKICGCEIDAKRAARSGLCAIHYVEYRRQYNSDYERQPLTPAQKQRRRELEQERRKDPEVAARHRASVNESHVKHKDKYAATRAEWRRNNPELARENDRKHRDPARASIAYKKWRQGKEKELAEAARQWKLENPERWRAIKRASNIKRKTREKIGGVWPLSADDITLLLVEQDSRCIYCFTEITISTCHVDHRTPLSRGGTSDPTNLQLTCPTCNLRKGMKTHEEFIACLQGSPRPES